MTQIVDTLNGIIWSDALVYLCLITGLYFSLKMKFFQVRHIKDMVKLLFKGSDSEKGVSSFQAFALSVSGRVGTGNIAGVATAIAMGGPGALFWMWAIAFLGAGSAYVESALAQVYKVEKDGEYRGGPAYYIEKGLGMKWYAITFAVATVVAMGFFLPGVQSNSIAAGINNAFGVSPYVTASILVLLLGVIIFGGVKRIGKAAEIIVPFMAIGYILVALIIIIVNITKLPEVIALVFKSAFALEPALAGIIGMAISWGVKRGIYSNEAGQGTGPQAAAAAEVSHPAKQGLVQAFSVYIDTLFVCSATGFMILITGMYNIVNPDGGFLVENMPGVAIGPAYTQKAVETLFPSFGSAFVAIALFFFAFTTLMAYYYIAETNVAYLINKGNNKVLINALRVALLASIFYGAIRTAELAWGLGDIGVGLMAWLNIIAIILLRKPAFDTLKDYEEQVSQGKDPVFDPVKLGIKNADFWLKYNAKKTN
ncbi:alanine or glycine:cation symporter, AGCS family [Alkalithermobacter thermoalcaliphilus JW-YL-7 = DSM 7308]|uniref:Alanine or glycine:cation symporter, AGCS family n=1 Tax=Alkalithermobacter thermoalcaliphilus JW-YL-7 = DSM 7308 TaxID=1121328 RepID=A0A150FST5_CLOPD|nr:amino acid carrier protein [[Clostridium] paradoxum JW-YL-7 = DSM 7308]SHL18711.1 alanine or glycine:cation symporter, AGCS family [[Clostridium] paradoxum JW-YL-7 = DSM 7308]